MTVTVKSNRAALVVPPSVRRQAGIKTGDRLEFKVSRRVITIVAKPSTADDEYTPAQRRVIDREIAKGLEDIRKGRICGPFNTVEEMAASIEAYVKRSRRAEKKPKPVR
jgi:bifunctional DNA-binding transcriptional regulator/antitoxin component of YhaV-PrlF toxin-antitoxin module